MIMYVNNILIIFLLLLPKFDWIFYCFLIETEIWSVRAHYNPRFVYFKHTFGRPKIVYLRGLSHKISGLMYD